MVSVANMARTCIMKLAAACKKNLCKQF